MLQRLCRSKCGEHADLDQVLVRCEEGLSRALLDRCPQDLSPWRLYQALGLGELTGLHQQWFHPVATLQLLLLLHQLHAVVLILNYLLT